MANALVIENDILSEEDIKTLMTTPFTDIVLLDGKQVEVFRCDTDGGLVINTQESIIKHAGHKVKSPVIITEKEYELLKEGRI